MQSLKAQIDHAKVEIKADISRAIVLHPNFKDVNPKDIVAEELAKDIGLKLAYQIPITEVQKADGNYEIMGTAFVFSRMQLKNLIESIIGEVTASAKEAARELYGEQIL